jgi:RHS repeat-associated protein
MSSRSMRRRWSVPVCREHVFGQSLANPGLFAATAARNGCSGRTRTAKLRGSAFEGCVARYYDPTTGQFLSLDPDVAETDAPFSYAGDDPLNELDPLGLADVGSYTKTECQLYSNVEWVPTANGGGHCVATAPQEPLLFHYVAHHYGAIISVVGGGVCIIASAGVCAVAIAVGTAAEIAQQATNGTITVRSAVTTGLLGLAALGTAGIGKVFEIIGDEALPLSSGAEKFTSTLPYTVTIRGTSALAAIPFAIPPILELQSPCP